MHSGTNTRLISILARISIYKGITCNPSLTEMKRYKKKSREPRKKKLLYSRNGQFEWRDNSSFSIRYSTSMHDIESPRRKLDGISERVVKIINYTFNMDIERNILVQVNVPFSKREQGNDFTTVVGRGTLCLDVYPSPSRIALKCIATCKGGCGSSKPLGIYRTPFQPRFELPLPHCCLHRSTLSCAIQECNVTTDVLSLSCERSSLPQTYFKHTYIDIFVESVYIIKSLLAARYFSQQVFKKFGKLLYE